MVIYEEVIVLDSPEQSEAFEWVVPPIVAKEEEEEKEVEKMVANLWVGFCERQ